MSESLSIQERNEGDVLVMHLAGSLDGHTFVQMERTLKQRVEDGKRIFIMELQDLGYIASAGVGVFINIQQSVAEKGGGLLLVNPSPTVKEVFDILGLQALFQIHQDVNAALAAAERLN
jgi:anti-sigma B factor antagonist